jgi:hypothetical protein
MKRRTIIIIVIIIAIILFLLLFAKSDSVNSNSKARDSIIKRLSKTSDITFQGKINEYSNITLYQGAQEQLGSYVLNNSSGTKIGYYGPKISEDEMRVILYNPMYSFNPNKQLIKEGTLNWNEYGSINIDSTDNPSELNAVIDINDSQERFVLNRRAK